MKLCARLLVLSELTSPLRQITYNAQRHSETGYGELFWDFVTPCINIAPKLSGNQHQIFQQLTQEHFMVTSRTPFGYLGWAAKDSRFYDYKPYPINPDILTNFLALSAHHESAVHSKANAVMATITMRGLVYGFVLYGTAYLYRLPAVFYPIY